MVFAHEYIKCCALSMSQHVLLATVVEKADVHTTHIYVYHIKMVILIKHNNKPPQCLDKTQEEGKKKNNKNMYKKRRRFHIGSRPSVHLRKSWLNHSRERELSLCDIINIYTMRRKKEEKPHPYRGGDRGLYNSRLVGITITTVTTSSGGGSSFLAVGRDEEQSSSFSISLCCVLCVCICLLPGRQSRALWLLLSVSRRQ